MSNFVSKVWRWQDVFLFVLFKFFKIGHFDLDYSDVLMYILKFVMDTKVWVF